MTASGQNLAHCFYILAACPGSVDTSLTKRKTHFLQRGSLLAIGYGRGVDEALLFFFLPLLLISLFNIEHERL